MLNSSSAASTRLPLIIRLSGATRAPVRYWNPTWSKNCGVGSVDTGFQRERGGHEVTALVATAGCDLDRERARSHASGGECRTLVVRRPFERHDLAAGGHLDGGGLHGVVEGQLHRGAGIEL